MNETSKRDVTVDIVKAIGIICMVGGHCEWPIKHFVYLFHMAIFFIASGYLFKPLNSADRSSVIRFIKRKLLTLWFPYVFWTAIYSFLHNFFIRINVYTDNPMLMEYVSGPYINTKEPWTIFDMLMNIIKALVLNGSTQIGGAFWFLATLMEISIGYCVTDYLLNVIFRNKNKVYIAQGIVSIVFLCIGFACCKIERSFAGMDRVCSYYILFHCGYTIKKYEISSKERKTLFHVVIGIVMIIVLLICNYFGSISLTDNNYINPMFLLIVSLAGWQFVYEIAFFLQKNSYLKKLFVCIGQNTLAVVILHFLCFKLVSFIGVLIYHQQWFLVAAFPVLYVDGFWWIAYMFVGLSIPICLNLLWKNSKKALLAKLNNYN